MRTRIAFATLCAIVVVGCSNKQKEEELQQQLAKAQSEETVLKQTLAERDKYFEDVMRAINEVDTDLESARSNEAKLVARAGGTEGPILFTNATTRETMMNNISEIGAALKENRKKIASLQKSVKMYNGKIKGLNDLVENSRVTL